jgi:DNA/RNA-binding domain of Phe-tRNA-synthetase-like protein
MAGGLSEGGAADSGFELRAAEGSVQPELRAEFPGLRLDWVTVQARMRPSPRELRQRLTALSNRVGGATVVTMRTKPVPHAYRAFFRQIGLDPDVSRIPSEEAAVARLLHGGFRSRDLIHDSLLIALVETGVPVWALDADLLDASGLGIRTSVTGDRLGDGANATWLGPGRLVVADARCVHALLFDDVAEGHGVGPRTTRIALFAVGVDGVPEIHLEEALWLCAEALKAG